ncbi:hypothetical protein V1504DRAFT_477834 [Lipomyces starkeyi]
MCINERVRGTAPVASCYELEELFQDASTTEGLSLHCHYPPDNEPSLPLLVPSQQAKSSTESRLLQKLQAQSKHVSTIDRYFDDDIISLANASDNENWLFEWWNLLNSR